MSRPEEDLPASELRKELEELLGEIRERFERAVTLSVRLGSRGPEEQREVAALWEATLGHLAERIREESRRSRQNLLAWISFSRFWRP